MNRKLQFGLIVLALGAWNVGSAQTPAPKPVTQVAQAGQAASRTIVAQAAEGVGGAALGAEATTVTIAGTTVTTTVVSTTALVTTATLGGVAQASTDGTTAPASHTP